MKTLFLAFYLLLPLAGAAAQNGHENIWITTGTEVIPPFQAKLAKLGWSGTVKIHATHEGVGIISIGEEHLQSLAQVIHDEFHRCGGFLVHASYEQARASIAELGKTQANPYKQIEYSLDRAEVIQNVYEALSEEEVLATISGLSSFPTRFYTATSGVDAVSWLMERWRKFTAQRPEVSIDLFQHEGWPQPSLILTLPGSTLADEVIVLGAHVDSISQGSEAPGADDDASGIAAITEVLRILVAGNYRPERTLKFMAYAAEEVGLRGSGEIAADFAASQTGVVGVLQLDMTNYKGSAEDILLVSDFTNEAQNRFLGDLIDTYVGVNWGTTLCGYACSDHASWNGFGYPASFPFEARLGEHNPNIHTANDTLEVTGNSVAHTMNFVKLALAYAVETGKGFQAEPTRLVYPWISHNDQFESIIIVNNPDPLPAEVQMEAIRADGGNELTETFTVPAYGFLKRSAGELFPLMGKGSGYTVRLSSAAEKLNGRWVTYNLFTTTGKSPSQGVAVRVGAEDGVKRERAGESILFGFLPFEAGLVSAPVIVNLGPENAAITLYFFDEAGTLLLIDDQTLKELPPFRPFAVVTRELAGQAAEQDLQLIAQSKTSPLTGVSFVFNGANEPAIGNISAIDFAPPELKE